MWPTTRWWSAPSSSATAQVSGSTASFAATTTSSPSAARTNVQDAAVLHVDEGVPLTLGADVSVGHHAMLHGCTVEDGALVGINAVVLNHAVIGRGSLVGAGALVPEGKVIPERSLAVGSPVRVVRTLTDEDTAGIERIARHYVEKARWYRAELRASRNEANDDHGISLRPPVSSTTMRAADTRNGANVSSPPSTGSGTAHGSATWRASTRWRRIRPGSRRCTTRATSPARRRLAGPARRSSTWRDVGGLAPEQRRGPPRGGRSPGAGRSHRGGRRRERLRPQPSAWTPCRAGHGPGLQPLQQRGDRGPLPATRPRRWTRS